MKKLLVLLTILMFCFIGTAKADIFSPIGAPSNPKVVQNLTLTPVTLTPAQEATLLTDAANVINYLGVKEGAAYSFRQKQIVVTTSATIVTYVPWNTSLDISLLSDDGVSADLAWNVGAYLSVKDVPILSLTQYLYVFAGVGGEENKEGTSFGIAPVLGADFKFNF